MHKLSSQAALKYECFFLRLVAFLQVGVETSVNRYTRNFTSREIDEDKMLSCDCVYERRYCSCVLGDAYERNHCLRDAEFYYLEQLMGMVLLGEKHGCLE